MTLRLYGSTDHGSRAQRLTPDRQTDRQALRLYGSTAIQLYGSLLYGFTALWFYGLYPTNRHTDRHTDKQTDRQTDKQKQTDR